jgi:Ca-activated chloride channel family protein
MKLCEKQFRTAIAFVILSLLCAANLPAQQTKEPAVTPAPPPVRLNVMVLDKGKHAVTDARRDELELFEDEVRQPIIAFARDGRRLRYALLVDNSGSMRGQFYDLRNAVRAIINGVYPVDEVYFARFVDSGKIQFALGPTSDQATLRKEADSFSIKGHQTALVDAVYDSIKKLEEESRKQANGRRNAIILITDGEDRGSLIKNDKLTQLLRESDTQVFIIGFTRELQPLAGSNGKSTLNVALDFMMQLAKESGGRIFFPVSAKELPWIADELMRSLHTQYLLSYTPATPKSKHYRKVKVTVADGPGQEKRTVITRAGYTAQR